jgi:hypothetical protein
MCLSCPTTQRSPITRLPIHLLPACPAGHSLHVCWLRADEHPPGPASAVWCVDMGAWLVSWLMEQRTAVVLCCAVLCCGVGGEAGSRPRQLSTVAVHTVAAASWCRLLVPAGLPLPLLRGHACALLDCSRRLGWD